MAYSPTLIVHILGGTVGLVSGTAAMTFRKGSPRHVVAGKVFVASMLTMGVFAVYLAITRHQPNNIGGGFLTVYLIGAAWLTARRRDGETSRFDWVVLLIPLAIGILLWMLGIKVLRSGVGSPDGVPVGMMFFMGSVCLLAAAGDVRMLVRGGVAGAKRITRASLAHVLWAVHRIRVFFPGTAKPAAATALERGARATSTLGFVQHHLVFDSHGAAAGFADFLANPSPLR
jgi:hypothetical protein